jgi:S-DNA-T family DNA segregation ATPase FtsK/SpoIIIE
LFDLTVVAGPDCGRRLPLTGQHTTLGRSEDCSLPLADETLSREHGAVLLSAQGVTIEDCGSTNGITVNGERLDGPRPIDRSSRVLLGDTEIRLRRATGEARRLPPDGRGHLLVRPSPVPTRAATAPTELRVPAPPVAEPGRSLPWITMLVPMPIAAVLAVVFGPQFLLFALLGPATMGATWWHDRRQVRRRAMDRAAEHDRQMTRHAHELADLLALEVAQLEQHAPDASVTVEAATTRSTRLWERSALGPGGLRLRLGTGQPLAAGVVVRDDQSRVTTRRLDRAPVVLPLADERSLTLVGELDRRTRVARHLVGQLLVWHAPTELALVVLAEASGQWGWLRWAPHVTTVSSPEVVAEAVALHRRRGRTVVLFVHDRDAVADELLTAASALVGSEEDDAVHLLETAPTPPPAAHGGSTLLLQPDGDVLTTAGVELTPLRADGVGSWWAERLARAIAPLRPDEDDTSSSPVTPWSALGIAPPPAGTGATRLADHVLTQWQATARPGLARATALVGSGPCGAFTIDLDTDGPHLLVGGTTGSGKSEVLRALVLGLAATRSPQDVTFLLIDYKGGSTFTDAARLPHTVGVVSDLDPHLAQRALRSLRAEIKRREQCFADAGVSDLAGYAAEPRPHSLPRLVVIVDEFRVLADEQPAFLSGLVRLATVGRSMGIHLVLATQRPAGAITPDIQANVNLRIALRMRDAHDSEQVIGSRTAADLDPREPGSGLARHGDGALTAFRALHPSGSSSAPRTGLRLHVLPSTPGAQPRVEGPPEVARSTASDEQRIVDAILAAHARGGADRPRAPWLPPLPDTLPASPPDPTRRPHGIPIGVVDLPDEQRQDALVWSPTDSLWRIVGGRGSGRSTALAGLVSQAVQHLSTDEIEVYAVGSGPPLRAVAPLPHCAAVVGLDEPGRLHRLVRRLRHEVDERRRTPERPVALVVVDDWDQVMAADRPWAATLEAVLRDVAATPGMTIAAAGGRALTSTRILGGGHLLCLGGLEPADLLLAGVRPRGSGETCPPGRAVRASDQVEAQVALPPEIVVPLCHSRRRPAPIEDLPRLVPLEAVIPPSPGEGTRPILAVADDADAVEWDVARFGRTLLVAGPAGSGRTSALRSLAAQWRGPVIVAGCFDAQDWPGATTIARSADELVTALAGAERPLVLADDVEALAPGLEQALLSLTGHLEACDGVLAAAASSHLLSTAFRGLVPALAGRGFGLLLSPSGPHEGSPFGTRVEVPATSCPGRGVLLGRGRAIEVQVVLTESLVTSSSRP